LVNQPLRNSQSHRQLQQPEDAARTPANAVISLSSLCSALVHEFPEPFQGRFNDIQVKPNRVAQPTKQSDADWCRRYGFDSKQKYLTRGLLTPDPVFK
jgi:hypothetical protein